MRVDRHALHARFERIKERALRKTEAAMQRELLALSRIDGARASRPVRRARAVRVT